MKELLGDCLLADRNLAGDCWDSYMPGAPLNINISEFLCILLGMMSSIQLRALVDLKRMQARHWEKT